MNIGQNDWANQQAALQQNYYRPPTVVEQLQKRKAELEKFLAIDHAAKVQEAQAELKRVSGALACLSGADELLEGVQ